MPDRNAFHRKRPIHLPVSHAEVPLWQREYWDRELRSGDSYQSKSIDVQNNPVRHGLVGEKKDWPYQGEIARLEW